MRSRLFGGMEDRKRDAVSRRSGRKRDAGRKPGSIALVAPATGSPSLLLSASVQGTGNLLRGSGAGCRFAAAGLQGAQLVERSYLLLLSGLAGFVLGWWQADS